MFMQVFIPFLDNGGIIAGAVVGIIVCAIVVIAIICVLVCCWKKIKGKFIGSLNQE